LSTQLNITNL